MNHLVDSFPEACTPLVDCLVALLPTVQGEISYVLLRFINSVNLVSFISLTLFMFSITEPVAMEMCHVLVTMATQVPSVLVHLRSELIDFFKSEVVQESSIVMDDDMRQASCNLLVRNRYDDGDPNVVGDDDDSGGGNDDIGDNDDIGNDNSGGDNDSGNDKIP